MDTDIGSKEGCFVKRLNEKSEVNERQSRTLLDRKLSILMVWALPTAPIRIPRRGQSARWYGGSPLKDWT